ncbi:MAG TPA: hypothetical protein VEV13_05900 [Candidatus Limnocylindria bacterium]|nr:hypothetical protein [Candidatus Limnocylindria bacterium]
MNALRSERGSVVVGGLTKLVIFLAVFGVVAYDAVAVAYTHFQAKDHGSVAADKAGDTWRETKDVKAAYDTARAALAPTGELIDPTTFGIDPETDTVTFQLTATAPTFMAQRLSYSRPWTVVTVEIATESAAPGP